ncbi:ubiquinone biosynthesis accessory factor UbiJ [Hydrogenophaga aquatica]
MNKPPFLFPSPEALESILRAVPQPPAWLQSELRNRVILLLNHVLMQEPQAMARLKRQQGKTVQVSWGRISLPLQASPAGLLALAPDTSTPDLTLGVTEDTPFSLAQKVLAGDKPDVDIQGDVQLAAEVAWLVDNVRWDIEEDLSRLIGDAAAHGLVGALRRLGFGLKGFAAQAANRAGEVRDRMAAMRPMPDGGTARTDS